jgi:hypothetical protein
LQLLTTHLLILGGTNEIQQTTRNEISRSD